jgi:enoyl-CoA hydratase/carnithine racemase
MPTENHPFMRRSLIGAAGLSAIGAFAVARRAAAQVPDNQTTMVDVPLSSGTTLTVERRGHVLIGLNRTFIQNRLDPDTRRRLTEAYNQYDRDPSLRAAILFGHGDNFSRGIDVDASQAAIIGRPAGNQPAAANGHLSKPVIVVAHGDTWNLGHELYLAGDIRIAAANTRFGQDEASHARFPGGGATVRFVREAGWGNAMRYMLTGDHWSAEESLRMGVTQEIAPTPEAALQAGVRIALKIAGCGPLGVKATLASAHQVIDPVEADALSKLGAQYSALYRTQDFIEGRKAEAEGRAPVYQGK